MAMAILAAGFVASAEADYPSGIQCAGLDCRNPLLSGWRTPMRLQGPQAATQRPLEVSGWRGPVPIRSPEEATHGPLEPAVVQTICRTGRTIKRGTGTIIAILKSRPRIGAVLTSVHTLQAGGDITIRYDGTIYPAKIVDQDGTLDIALLTFDAPANCYYMPLANEDAKKGTLLVWEGFTPIGPVRREGIVLGYEGSAILVSGSTAEGMSGGPVFSRARGLVSVVTSGIGLTPGRSTETEGPALSWIRTFLRRGRYAWVLEGCVTPPEDLPPIPEEDTSTLVPVQPIPAAVDLSGILAELAALRETIEHLELQQGKKGERGEKGLPGEDGQQGLQGEAAASPVIDYDVLAAEVLKRLPPFYVRHVDDVTGHEIVEAISLDEGFTIRNTVPE